MIYKKTGGIEDSETALKIATNKINDAENYLDYDADGDKKVTSADSRLLQRSGLGLESDSNISVKAPASAGVSVTETDGEQPLSQRALGWMESAYNMLDSTEPFKYDMNMDPLYQQYKERYIAGGQKAMEDTMGTAAGMTGGYASSYGQIAGQQAYNDYMSGLNDVGLQLEENAYGKYTDEQNRLLNKFNLAQNLYSTGYTAEKDERDEAYNKALLMAENGDYSALGQYLGMDMTDSQNDYKLQKAYEAYQMTGDTSAMKALGADTSYIDSQRTAEEQNQKITQAAAMAEYGDYSALEALGIDVSAVKNEAALNIALKYAEIGDYSLLEGLGVDTSRLKAEDAASLAKTVSSGGSGTKGGSDDTKTADEEAVANIKNLYLGTAYDGFSAYSDYKNYLAELAEYKKNKSGSAPVKVGAPTDREIAALESALSHCDYDNEAAVLLLNSAGMPAERTWQIMEYLSNEYDEEAEINNPNKPVTHKSTDTSIIGRGFGR